jgi:hypothetical protein
MPEIPPPPPWRTTYDALFLLQDDAPELQPREVVHHPEPEPDDLYFIPCGGRMGGFNAWQAFDEEGQLRRIVDIRWLFDTIEGARRYHRLQMAVNSERGIESPEKCQLGEGGKIFTLPDPFGSGLQMSIYLFTIRQVCVKIFFANIPRERQEQVLARTVTHIENALARGPLPESLPVQPPLLVLDERWPKGPLAYESVLAGQPLLPGKGIGDKLTFNHAISDMYQYIGGGEETCQQPFVYLFTKGAFALAVRGEYSRERDTFPIKQICYWDDPFAVLKTPEGLSVGNTREDVVRAYGDPIEEQDGCLVYPGIIYKIGPVGKVISIDLLPSPKK